MAAAQMFVFDADNNVWIPWDGAGGGGGGGGDVNVTGGTLDAVTTITNPVQLAAGAAAIGSVTLGAGAAAIGSVTLGAGANAIGKLAANAGVNIGSVALVAAAGVNIGSVALLASAGVTIGNVGLLAAQTLAAVTDITNPVGLKAILTTGPDVFGNLRASSLANLGGATANFPGGALMTTRPGDWSNVSDPGAATKATTTRAAPGAGKAHVITSITGSVLAVNAQVGLTMSLTDATLGVIWSTKFLPPVGQGRDFQLTGLNILISSNAAVTLDFNAAPAAGNFQSCSMTGYTM